MENSLSQLKEIMPENAYGANSTMFSMSLEGWRRGLKLKFFTKYVKNQVKIRYTLSSEERDITFQLSLAETVPKETRKTTRSKKNTKKALQNSNVPTPKGKSFDEENSDEEVINYAKTLEYPLVIKPTNASLGIGVVTGIYDDQTLVDSVKNLRNKKGYKEMIVEQQVTGEDTRLFVVGNQVCSAFKRIAANVVGDGKHTIEELIKIKNKERRINPHLSKSQIKLGKELREYLESHGLSLETIPQKGERVFLNESTIASAGAETVEVTNELTEESKRIAVEAAKSLPGLVVCGVDIMIDKKKRTNYVLELNSRPNIGGSLFPVEGEAQNISKHIIDYYFPESISDDETSGRNKLYFDYESIEKILKSGIVEEVTVPSLPDNDLVFKQLKVSGKVQGVGFRNWVYKKAIGRKISGYVKNLKDKSVLIVAAGSQNKVDQFTEVVRKHNTKKIQVEKVKEDEYTEPVKVGFEIVNKPGKIKTLKNNLNKEQEKNKKLTYELEQTTKQLKSLKQSKSWKYTLPMRKIIRLIKNK
ncbi:acylphosphatase [Lentibacillus sp. CBA3610]|uniref:acylphosphatase n=1 Tax=Lentibacillus sp. CBA3610 TaxID=2518176 RepID=UPI00159601F3|nr:acylphosphatase [Lentibacillus sp. CBA3610]QKY70431.1 hypothetical protein Len3610_13255 [Lentibacillus sp. CBA3610]